VHEVVPPQVQDPALALVELALVFIKKSTRIRVGHELISIFSSFIFEMKL